MEKIKNKITLYIAFWGELILAQIHLANGQIGYSVAFAGLAIITFIIYLLT